MGTFNIDLRTVPPQTVPEPVPQAWYRVVIVKSNMKQTSKGDGGYLELQCEIIEGQYSGRLLYWNLNIFNASQTAVEIAYKTLSAIGHCIGQFNAADQKVRDNALPNFHNQPFYVFAVVTQGTQGPINNIRGCKDINGLDPGKQSQGPSQSAPPGSFGAPSAPPMGFGGPAPTPPQQAAPAGQSWGGQQATPAPQQSWGQPAGQGFGPVGGTQPGGFTPPQQAAPAGQSWGGPAIGGQPVAAPQGQAWQPGTNTAPPINPAAGPGPAPQAWQAWQANAPQAQPQQSWPAQGGQPTQPQQQAPAPNAQWTQGPAQSAAGPWARPA